jgi:hypothetical protein
MFEFSPISFSLFFRVFQFSQLRELGINRGDTWNAQREFDGESKSDLLIVWGEWIPTTGARPSNTCGRESELAHRILRL